MVKLFIKHEEHRVYTKVSGVLVLKVQDRENIRPLRAVDVDDLKR
jgi:hypothetical protein